MATYNWATAHYSALESAGLGEEVVCTPPQGGAAVTVSDAVWMDVDAVVESQDGLQRQSQEADVLISVARLPRADIGMTLRRSATGVTARATRVEKVRGSRWLCRVSTADAIEKTAGLYRPKV